MVGTSLASPGAAGRGDDVRATSRWSSPWTFVLVTILCSWVPWSVLLATTGDVAADPWSTVLWILGGCGPTLAAVVLAAAAHGRDGVRLLLRGLTRWRLGRWYLLLALPGLIAVVAVLSTVVTGQASVQVAGPSHWLLLPAMLLSGVLLGGLEEVGWRGFMLPRLQARIGALAASFVIGLVWSLWHAPLFMLGSTSQGSLPVPWFVIHAIALSVVLTWLYNSTGGSLLLVVVYHGAVNGWYEAALGGFAPGALTGFLAPAAILTALVAAWLLIRHWPAEARRSGQIHSGDGVGGVRTGRV